MTTDYEFYASPSSSLHCSTLFLHLFPQIFSMRETTLAPPSLSLPVPGSGPILDSSILGGSKPCHLYVAWSILSLSFT